MRHIRRDMCGGAPSTSITRTGSWIVEAIGDPRALEHMLKALGQRDWKGKAVKMRTFDEQGRPVVRTIG